MIVLAQHDTDITWAGWAGSTDESCQWGIE